MAVFDYFFSMPFWKPPSDDHIGLTCVLYIFCNLQSKKDNAMRYITPPIGKHKIVYKGRRYLVIELAGEEPFEYVNKQLCDYVFYDKLLDAIVAVMRNLGNGAIEVEVQALHASVKSYENMELAVKETPKHVIWAMRDFMGK